jgi:hypothetical protein
LRNEDRDSLNRLRALSPLLSDQVRELEAFWQTGDPAHSLRYDNLRQKAWLAISQLLGIER